MIDTMGIILASDEKIAPLTDIRAVSALPVAGSYRLIDFVLSNMANSGITNVGVITTSNYSSLMDHIKSGKPWDLDRKQAGLNILPPNMQKAKYGMLRGDIDMLDGVYNFINRSKQTYVILSLGTSLYNINFADVIENHIENQADITVIYKDMESMDESELSRFTLVEMDSDKRVTDIEIKPYYPKTNCAGIDVYVMERALLASILDECSARGDHDLLKDAIIKKLDALRVYGYQHTGYMDKIDSLKSYFKNNMIFLDSEIRHELFNHDNPIYTKSKDQCPTKYSGEAIVENSFISDGCDIQGTVINSILSRGVKVGKGSVVKNSVIMQDGIIGNNVYLDHVIFDKEVYISDGRKLLGQESYPLAIEKGGKI